jgi:hypothetical protein
MCKHDSHGGIRGILYALLFSAPLWGLAIILFWS